MIGEWNEKEGRQYDPVMRTHKTDSVCPVCRKKMVLTTEWNWDDEENVCTAVECCPICRTETGYSEDPNVLRMANVKNEGEHIWETEHRAIQTLKEEM